MDSEKKIQEIRIAVFADDRTVSELEEQISRLLCSDPHHPPPCRVPWSMSTVSGQEVVEAHQELREQFEIENPEG